MLVHGGMAKSDWFSDKLQRKSVKEGMGKAQSCAQEVAYLFNALSISMVTNTDRAIVIG